MEGNKAGGNLRSVFRAVDFSSPSLIDAVSNSEAPKKGFREAWKQAVAGKIGPNNKHGFVRYPPIISSYFSSCRYDSVSYNIFLYLSFCRKIALPSEIHQQLNKFIEPFLLPLLIKCGLDAVLLVKYVKVVLSQPDCVSSVN